MRNFTVLGVAALSLAAFGSKQASAALVYDNTGGGFAGLFVENTPGAIYFDDATAATPAPFKINQFSIGYENTTASATNFDILVQFFNTVNYGAASNAPVGTNPIGSLIDITGKSLSATSVDSTGLVTLTTGVLPISTTGTVGFEVEFVTPGVTTFGTAGLDSALLPIFNSTPPLVGSSSTHYAYDYLNTGTIVGDSSTGDVFNNSDGSGIFAQIGATAVPEPTSLSILGAGAVMLLSRSKRNKIGDDGSTAEVTA